jgi:quinolinate synthase
MTIASPAFPSLLISADSLVPQGSFAENQAQFLNPDRRTVDELRRILVEQNTGIVAHFYMDVELQGILTACQSPNIFIADSLAMSDRAVTMAERGIEAIIVLGVDFMSENVRAVLDAAGHEHVRVFRVSDGQIGCSLAESAEAAAYGQWLEEASGTPNSLHVIYINTSLEVKARSHYRIPTITCTSSNVLQTILQAAAEIPGVHIWYGPDTYMGANLATIFGQMADLSDAAIAEIHADHDRESIAQLASRFHYFRQGTCFVHHLFGSEVVERVRRDYADAYCTAHLEVPGEMFGLAAAAQHQGRGVVGSTSNILAFIGDLVRRRAAEPGGDTLPVILGTEAGMITSIVRDVQETLQELGRADIHAEIIFPVSNEAVAMTSELDLSLVPGVQGGEGCSTAGGCATCPYMKMNSLEALFDVLEALGAARDLSAYRPRAYTETIGGRTAAELGSEPILHMRYFQRHGSMDPALLTDVASRS